LYRLLTKKEKKVQACLWLKEPSKHNMETHEKATNFQCIPHSISTIGVFGRKGTRMDACHAGHRTGHIRGENKRLNKLDVLPD
jgi:hypothetical protein